MVRGKARNVLPWELEPTVRADVLGRRIPVVLAHHAALHQREVAAAGLARAVGRRPCGALGGRKVAESVTLEATGSRAQGSSWAAGRSVARPLARGTLNLLLRRLAGDETGVSRP